MKFLAFTGLGHHLAKMRPVFATLEERGHQVELVTTQNFGGGLPFDFELPLRDAELAYSMIDEGHRHPDYAAAADRNARELFRRSARRFARGATPPWYVSGGHYGYAVAEAVEDRSAFEVLLAERRPDAVLVLHEANFWARSLLAAAHAAGIPAFSFQEGEFADHCPDALLGELGLMSRRVFLWGERHARRLRDAGVDPERLHVTGPPHFDPTLREDLDPAAARKRLGLEVGAPTVVGLMARQWAYPLPPDFAPVLAEYFSVRPEQRLVMKWSPGEDAPQRAACDTTLSAALGDRYTSLENEDGLLCARAADVAFGYGSTLVTEALALGRPTLELTWGPLGDTAAHRGLSLAEVAGIGTIARTGDLLQLDALLEFGLDAPTADRIAAWRHDAFGDLDGQASTRCADVIIAEISQLR